MTILSMSHPQHFTEQPCSYTFHHRQCISHDSLRLHMAPLVTRNVHGTRHVSNSYCIGNVHRMVLAILQQNFACNFHVVVLAEAPQNVVASQCPVAQCYFWASRAQVSFGENPSQRLFFQHGVDPNWRHACHQRSQSSRNAQNTCLQMSSAPTIQTDLLLGKVLGEMEDTFGHNSNTNSASAQKHTSPSRPKPWNHTHPCVNAATIRNSTVC